MDCLHALANDAVLCSGSLASCSDIRIARIVRDSAAMLNFCLGQLSVAHHI